MSEINLIYIFYFIFSFSAIYVRYRAFRFYAYIKPLPLALLVIFSFFLIFKDSPSDAYPITIWLMVLGFFFGLLGDIFLLKERFFLAGLSAFLIGHILYTIYFIISAPFYFSFLPVLLLTLTSLIYGAVLISNLIRKNKKQYIVPVIFYISGISIMVLSGMGMPEYFIFSGCLLFAVSDTILSINKFIKNFASAELFILSTYFTGQFLIFFGTFPL